MPVFTKADIEIETFTESIGNGSIKKLYTYLEELRSQGIYVVDVTLVSNRVYESSFYGYKTYHEYMTRLVRPQYHVELITNLLDKSTYVYRFRGSESLGFFKSDEEVEAIRKEYLSKSTTDVQYVVDVKRLEPLNESI